MLKGGGGVGGSDLSTTGAPKKGKLLVKVWDLGSQSQPSPNCARPKIGRIVSWGNFGHGATSVKKSLRNHFGRINNV